jgi:hypothetical protein
MWRVIGSFHHDQDHGHIAHGAVRNKRPTATVGEAGSGAVVTPLSPGALPSVIRRVPAQWRVKENPPYARVIRRSTTERRVKQNPPYARVIRLTVEWRVNTIL